MSTTSSRAPSLSPSPPLISQAIPSRRPLAALSIAHNLPTTPQALAPQPPSHMSAAERAEQELRDAMRATPPISEVDLPLGPLAADFGTSTGTGNEISADSDSSSELRASGSMDSSQQNPRRNESASARRLALKAKLHPYQRDDIDSFVKDSMIGRQVRLMVGQYAILNKLEEIVTAAPVFTISEALQGTINGYTLAVLLSDKLTAYKGTVPRDHVLKILYRNQINLPAKVEQDRYAMTQIKEAVSDTLTQFRSRIKKDIYRSKITRESSIGIYDLATHVVASTRCAITATLCARLALLRKMHAENSGSKFWDTVDTRLVLIRTTAAAQPGEFAKNINKVFADILDRDRKVYGVDTASGEPAALTAAQDDPWQQLIDNEIAGAPVTGS